MRFVRTAVVVPVLLLLVLGLSGCNTMEGMGRDVQDAGEAIEEGAS